MPCGTLRKPADSSTAATGSGYNKHMLDAPLPTRLVIYPDPRLRQKCAPVTKFDERLAALADQMLKLMKANRGVGLAGPQVGVMERIFVCNPTGEEGDDRVYINPELVDLTGALE